MENQERKELEKELFDIVINECTENDDQDPISIIEKTIRIIVEKYVILGKTIKD